MLSYRLRFWNIGFISQFYKLFIKLFGRACFHTACGFETRHKIKQLLIEKHNCRACFHTACGFETILDVFCDAMVQRDRSRMLSYRLRFWNYHFQYPGDAVHYSSYVAHAFIPLAVLKLGNEIKNATPIFFSKSRMLSYRLRFWNKNELLLNQ